MIFYKNIFQMLLVSCYAIYGCQSVFLAFALPEYNPIYANFILFDYYACLAVGLVYFLLKRRVFGKKLLLLVVPCTYWIFQSCTNLSNYKGEWTIPLIIICMYILFEKRIQVGIYRCFYWIVIVTNIVSLFMVICFILPIDIGFVFVPYYSGAQLASYIQWGIFAIYQYEFTFRLCGIFNEPGALGTVCALLFILSYEKSKFWEKFVLIVSGMLTLSLAFGILIISFTLCKSFIGKNRMVNIFSIFTLIAAFMLTPNIDFGDDAVNSYFSRFEITEDGLKGDNRMEEGRDTALYEQFLNSNDILWGYGAGYYHEGGAGLKVNLLMPYGLIGTGIILTEWILLFYCILKNKKEGWLFAFLFLLSVYQRPYALFGIYGYILSIGGLEWIEDKKLGKF